jgi:quinolinate synthase
MNETTKIRKKIEEKKAKLNAVILAHNYQRPEIQDLADFVGDSLELSRKAAETQADIIVFCGVSFMAETAKILAPEKTVLLPVEGAGCPMADMINPEHVKKLKAQHPDASVVCYVNSSTEVKAVSDICCTSANALKIVESLPNKKIIFIPDEGLGGYVAEHSNKEVILFPGYCPTHYMIREEDLVQAKNCYPNEPVIVHPECRKEVRDASDYIAGTGGMVTLAKEHPSNKFIIGTEEGMIYRLKTLVPGKSFHLLSSRLYCPNMKKTTLTTLLACMENKEHEIILSDSLMKKARQSIARMLEVA